MIELPLYLGRISDALKSRAAAAAANAMAQTFQRELVNVTLRQTSHPAGTVTTAAPGQPPALVTGTLRRSAQTDPAQEGGTRATAAVRVSTVYARIQELGGVITVKRAKYLTFQYPAGRWHQVKSVRLPPRPYMAPTLHRLEEDGQLRDAGKQAALQAIGESASG
jgi:phage gpG-like protein